MEFMTECDDCGNVILFATILQKMKVNCLDRNRFTYLPLSFEQLLEFPRVWRILKRLSIDVLSFGCLDYDACKFLGLSVFPQFLVLLSRFVGGHDVQELVFE